MVIVDMRDTKFVDFDFPTMVRLDGLPLHATGMRIWCEHQVTLGYTVDRKACLMRGEAFQHWQEAIPNLDGLVGTPDPPKWHTDHAICCTMPT